MIKEFLKACVMLIAAGVTTGPTLLFAQQDQDSLLPQPTASQDNIDDEFSDNQPEKRFPTGCLPVGSKFRNYHVIFTPSSKSNPQTAYLVHNLSHESITLYQTRTGDEQYIMHINTTFAPGNWRTYAMDEPSTKFICTADEKTGEYKIIDCSKVLDICEYPLTRFGDNHRGNYWLKPNTTGNSAARALQAHGVLLFDGKRKALEEGQPS